MYRTTADGISGVGGPDFRVVQTESAQSFLPCSEVNIEFRAYHKDQQTEVKPQEKEDERTEGTVQCYILRYISNIYRKQSCKDHPGSGRQRDAGKSVSECTLCAGQMFVPEGTDKYEQRNTDQETEGVDESRQRRQEREKCDKPGQSLHHSNFEFYKVNKFSGLPSYPA